MASRTNKPPYEPRYSEKLSVEFWNRVNALSYQADWSTVYSLGCALQELETRVLKALHNAESNQTSRDATKGA